MWFMYFSFLFRHNRPRSTLSRVTICPKLVGSDRRYRPVSSSSSSSNHSGLALSVRSRILDRGRDVDGLSVRSRVLHRGRAVATLASLLLMRADKNLGSKTSRAASRFGKLARRNDARIFQALSARGWAWLNPCFHDYAYRDLKLSRNGTYIQVTFLRLTDLAATVSISTLG